MIGETIPKAMDHGGLLELMQFSKNALKAGK
jgi:hypothetical protein